MSPPKIWKTLEIYFNQIESQYLERKSNFPREDMLSFSKMQSTEKINFISEEHAFFLKKNLGMVSSLSEEPLKWYDSYQVSKTTFTDKTLFVWKIK